MTPPGAGVSRGIEDLLVTFCFCLFYGRVVVSLTHSPFPFSILKVPELENIIFHQSLVSGDLTYSFVFYFSVYYEVTHMLMLLGNIVEQFFFYLSKTLYRFNEVNFIC